MTSHSLLQQTRLRFPRFDDAQVQISPIEKGGSDRKFYRVRLAPEHSIILVKYDLAREENRRYVEIAEFLQTIGVRAPRIYFHDESEGLIWVEDLGESDLWSFRGEDWLVRRAFYESALDEVAKLHRASAASSADVRRGLPAEFNAALYTWEQNYFFENCLGRHFGVAEERWQALAALPALAQIAAHLASLPRVLVHRDFQSQNVIIRQGHAHLIDFQGMRPGLAEYDLASLLYDPYVTIVPAERAELLAHYRATNPGVLAAEFEQTFRLCAMQRLMQALGAYGFLGLVKGNKAFLQHVPAAMALLRGVLAEISGLDELRALVREL